MAQLIKNSPNLHIVMKKLFVVLITILGLFFSANAQDPQWLNYNRGDKISSLAEEGNNMWVGTIGGLVKLDKITGISTFYNRANSGLPYNQISSITINENGIKWIGTNRGGLAEFDNTNWTNYIKLNCTLYPSIYNNINAIVIDENGTKWIGTQDRGLVAFDGTNWTFYNLSNSGLQTDHIFSLAIDENGTMWIGSDWGFYKYDGTNWTHYSTSNGVYLNRALSIAIDQNGTKWVACRGLIELTDTSWTHYQIHNSGIPSNIVYSIAIDENNTKWIGTDTGGLAEFDGANWITYDIFVPGYPLTHVSSIAIEDNGTKWFGASPGGLASFDGTNWTLYSVDSGLECDYVHSIAIDQNGTKWIGTYCKGLKSFDGTNWTTNNTINSKLPVNDVETIAIDENDTKWIGFIGNEVGLVAYNENGIPVYVDNFTSVENQIKIYPNPTNQLLTVEISSQTKVSQIDIINIHGMLLSRKIVGNEQNSIDVSGLPGGIYIIQVRTESGVFSQKFIKQ